VGQRPLIPLLAVIVAIQAISAADLPPIETLTLEQATVEALTKNAGIQAALRQWNAARARVPQAKAWDDPRLSYDNVAGRFVNMSANAMPDQTLTIEQVLPISGKNLSRARAEAAEALVSYEEMRRRELDIVSQVRAAWLRLLNVQHQLDLNQQDVTSLSGITAAMKSLYQAGKGSAPDLLRIQIEASKLDEDRVSLERARSQARTRLNVLMNRPADKPFSTAGPGFTPKPAGDEKVLAAQMLAVRPEIRMAQDRVEAERARLQLSKREWIPDPAINVNAQRYNAAAQAVSQVGGGISFNIPWVNPGKYREGIHEAEESLGAAMAELQLVRTESLGLLHDQLVAIDAAHHHSELYSGRILTQAQQAFDAAQSSYAAGKISFGEWIEAQRTLHEVQSTAFEMQADYLTALAEMEALVGAESAAPTQKLKKDHP
jgi:outer membrane protein TolC